MECLSCRGEEISSVSACQPGKVLLPSAGNSGEDVDLGRAPDQDSCLETLLNHAWGEAVFEGLSARDRTYLTFGPFP
jgi:hypothetical protein